jgi:antitoxin ParD1/3/4
MKVATSQTSLNVSLTPELEQMIQKKVRSGMYQTASEVVRESLRLLKGRDEMQQQRMAELRADIAVGLRELDAGQSVVLDKKALVRIKAKGRATLKTI